MDRLIYKEADGDLTCLSRDFDKVFPALYAYEETELTPDQIRDLKDRMDAINRGRNEWSRRSIGVLWNTVVGIILGSALESADKKELIDFVRRAEAALNGEEE